MPILSPSSGMIGDMINRVRAALLVGACLVALTGCVKVDADLKVGSNETVSGNMKIGVELHAPGQSDQAGHDEERCAYAVDHVADHSRRGGQDRHRTESARSQRAMNG